MARFTSLLSFFVAAVLFQVNAAPVEVRTPQNSGFNTGECQNAQVNAVLLFPEAVRALQIESSEAAGKSAALGKVLAATATALNGSIQGLNNVAASVESGVQVKIADLNALNAGVANAQAAFAAAKGDAEIIANAKDVLDQAVDAVNLVTNTCL